MEQLSEAEWKVLHVCWRLKRASTKEVHAELGSIAPRTVKAQLARIARKGYLEIDTTMPTHYFEPTISRERVLRGAIRRFLSDVVGSAREDLELVAQEVERLGGVWKEPPASDQEGKNALEIFGTGARLLHSVRKSTTAELPKTTREQFAKDLEKGLLVLSGAIHEYEPDAARLTCKESRRLLAMAMGRLLLDAGIPPRGPALGWLESIETELMPALMKLEGWQYRQPS